MKVYITQTAYDDLVRIDEQLITLLARLLRIKL